MGAYESFGRKNQKRRTRAALKDAASEIVREGGTPSVAEAAERAGISRTTAYRYFPNQDALVAEVILDEAIRPDLSAVYDAATVGRTASERLDAVVRADHALVVRHETAFRTAIRAMMLPDDGGASVPRRPGNRLRYLEDALQPVAAELGPERLGRLVRSLAMCVGLESMMVMEDICGLGHAEAEKTKCWAAAALLRAALSEAREEPEG